MAVDRKADYYNPPSDYQDMDGNWRTFTYVDHDKKTSRTKMGRESSEALEEKRRRIEELQKSIYEGKVKVIEEILSLPPIYAATDDDRFLDKVLYREFLTVDNEKVTWNEQSLAQACLLDDTLRHNLRTRVWRQTVKEEYWFEDMSYEDILAGEWKKLT